MILLSAETWIHAATLVGQSASAAYLVYGAWLVFRHHVKFPVETQPALRHLALGDSA